MSRVVLKQAQGRVADAAQRGVPVVFADALEERSTGPGLPPFEDDSAWGERSIDGTWLTGLLLSGEVHPRGLDISGVRIMGGLDLAGAELSSRLRLVDCQLGTGTIGLRDAQTRSVVLHGVACGGIDAGDAHIEGSLVLQECQIGGVVRLVDARIEASVRCDGSRLTAPGEAVVNASGVRVGGALMMRDGFVAHGEVRISQAEIGGNMILRGARIDNTEGRGRSRQARSSRLSRRFAPEANAALRANGTEVGGYVALGPGFEALGETQLQGVRVGRDLIGFQGRFDNPPGDALSLEGAVIGGGVFLQEAHAKGQVRLVNCC